MRCAMPLRRYGVSAYARDERSRRKDAYQAGARSRRSSVMPRYGYARHRLLARSVRAAANMTLLRC